MPNAQTLPAPVEIRSYKASGMWLHQLKRIQSFTSFRGSWCVAAFGRVAYVQPNVGMDSTLSVTASAPHWLTLVFRRLSYNEPYDTPI
jgi:hypothetical protein